MKEIKAFIRPEKLIEVSKNLKKEHYCCFTVFEGEGVGNFVDPETEFPSIKFPFLHNKVIKIEMVCKKENVEDIVKTIRNSARTGKKGDGLIYVCNVENKLRIRDGS